jgi:tRNA threonylcarbamoyl adenosine modification protein YeaZ
MKILALEFSSPQRSVAVISSAQTSEVVETGRDTNAPLVMVEDVLREAKLEREQVECVAVGIGPGSYTGIRSAISIAQGWQLARGLKLLAVSSVDCVAAQALAEGMTGQVSVIIDAQRDEFYLAAYDLGQNSFKEIERLKIVTRAEVEQRAVKGSVLIGPEVAKWFPAGKTILPRAAMLGKLALGRSDFIAGEKLEPIYLRETAFVKAPPARVIS